MWKAEGDESSWRHLQSHHVVHMKMHKLFVDIIVFHTVLLIFGVLASSYYLLFCTSGEY